MSIASPDQLLVVLTAAPSLESQIVDWLLSQDGGLGFSSVPIHGHSTRHDHLTIAEQVSGRQKRLQFQVQIAAADLDGFLHGLEVAFGGADLHYWVVPVLAGGHLAGPAKGPGVRNGVADANVARNISTFGVDP